MPGTPSAAISGFGTTFAIGDGATPEVFTPIAEVGDITLPNTTRETYDVTHQESPDQTKEFIAGLIDTGKLSFDVNFIPGGTTETALDAALTAGKQNYQITFPNAKTWTFAAILTDIAPKAPHNGKMVATISFQASGSITKA